MFLHKQSPESKLADAAKAACEAMRWGELRDLAGHGADPCLKDSTSMKFSRASATYFVMRLDAPKRQLAAYAWVEGLLSRSTHLGWSQAIYIAAQSGHPELVASVLESEPSGASSQSRLSALSAAWLACASGRDTVDVPWARAGHGARDCAQALQKEIEVSGGVIPKGVEFVYMVAAGAGGLCLFQYAQEAGLNLIGCHPKYGITPLEVILKSASLKWLNVPGRVGDVVSWLVERGAGASELDDPARGRILMGYCSGLDTMAEWRAVEALLDRYPSACALAFEYGQVAWDSRGPSGPSRMHDLKGKEGDFVEEVFEMAGTSSAHLVGMVQSLCARGFDLNARWKSLGAILLERAKTEEKKVAIEAYTALERDLLAGKLPKVLCPSRVGPRRGL